MLLRHPCTPYVVSREWECPLCGITFNKLIANTKGHQVTPTIQVWRHLRRKRGIQT